MQQIAAKIPLRPAGSVALLRPRHSRCYQREMLAEGLIYLMSLRGTPPAFRRHLGGAVGLWARGRRQARAWAPHLERSRALIGGAMAALPRRRTVAVLGAGPLFDVPVEVLGRAFERVLLFDLAHLLPARRRIAPLTNVEAVWRNLAPPGETTPLAFLEGLCGLDWVISVNLVSQIAHAARAGDERAAIDRHLAGLDALPCPVTLVTDTQYRVIDRRGTVLETFDMLYGRALPAAAQRWEWEVAPLGEESASARRVHDVSGFPDWHAARRG